MADIKVTLKDGSVKEFAAGSSLLEIAKGLNQKLGKQALLAVVDGVNKDLSDVLDHDATVEFFEDENGIVIKKYSQNCIFCDSSEQTVELGKKRVCKKFANYLEEVFFSKYYQNNINCLLKKSLLLM